MPDGLSGWNGLPLASLIIEQTTPAMVKQTAQQVLIIAQELAPEQTGFLISSGYIKTNTDSSYGQNAGGAPGDAYLLPEVDPPPADTVYIAFGANYAIYLEFGTVKMGAQPFLIPALEAVAESFKGGATLTQALDDGLVPSGE